MKKLSIILSLAMFPAMLMAQGLHKDIDVEQSVTPAKREASRINVLPTVSLPAVQPLQLQFSDRVYTTSVPPRIRVLDPVAWNVRPAGADYRGYLDLGIGAPLMQGAVSAGYRVIASEATALNVWGQYDGDVYRRSATTWHDHTATAGADVRHNLKPTLWIGGHAFYTYGFHDMPGYWGRFSQGSSRVDVQAEAGGRTGALTLEGGIGYSRFAFTNPHWSDAASAAIREDEPQVATTVRGTAENTYTVNLKGSLQMGENSWLGLGVDASIVSATNHAVPVLPFEYINQSRVGHTSRGLASLKPSYTLRGESASATIGAVLDIAKNNGGSFKAAPDVTLAWHGIQYVGAELKVHGGSSLNTLSELYEITPYLNPTFTYLRSHAPYIIDAKIAFGPFLGGTVELFGGYGKANNMLMPVMSDYMAGGLTMQPVNITGYRYGVRLGYDNGKTLSISASWQHSPGEWRKAWLDCRDRARNVVNASMSLRPISRLKVDVDYELRAGRCIYGYDPEPDQLLGLTYYPLERRGLGAVSDLSAGATYMLSGQLSVFARAQNILSRHALLLGDRPAQGFNVLAGAALKF